MNYDKLLPLNLITRVVVGDSGGAIYCKDSNANWLQIGVTSSSNKTSSNFTSLMEVELNL